MHIFLIIKTLFFLAGQSRKKILRRNKDFFYIEKNLNNLKQAGTLNDTGLVSDYFDHCFWMGDFNYRINLPMHDFVNLIKTEQFEVDF